MTLYAYLRVSTDAQDVNNQKLGVLEYCARQNLGGPVLVEDTASGKMNWSERELGALLSRTSPGDILVVSEISRLARSALQVLEVMKVAAEKCVAVHVVKNAMIMDGSIQSKIYATIFGLAAEIERDFIAQRTREALARKKADGFTLGRPTGEAEKLALDAYAADIDHYLEIKLGKRDIAKLLGVSPNTLYSWIRRRRPELLLSQEQKD
jgi:DNA invertase Pin-like site-specific DNA recombinase